MRIGLTGGIASGKSAVAGFFRQLGITVVDADQVAREVVEPGQPALETIVAEFGASILDPQGRLDRATLRERVFSDPAQRKKLESILHPAIRKRMDQLASQASSPYVILDIPLLLETGQYHNMDRVLVVECPRELQLSRLMERDRCPREQAEAILSAQASREERNRIADDLVDNSGDLAQLEQQVHRLHHQYLDMAKP